MKRQKIPILQDICTDNRDINLSTLEQVIVLAIEIADHVSIQFRLDLILVQIFVQVVKLKRIKIFRFKPEILVAQFANELVVTVEIDVVLVGATNLATFVARNGAEFGAIVPAAHGW